LNPGCFSGDSAPKKTETDLPTGKEMNCSLGGTPTTKTRCFQPTLGSLVSNKVLNGQWMGNRYIEVWVEFGGGVP